MKFYELSNLEIDFETSELLLDIFELQKKINSLKKEKPNNQVITKQYVSELNSSNTIEGIIVKNARLLFVEKKELVTKSEKEWYGLKLAYKWVIQNASKRSITLESLKELHLLMLNGAKPNIAGIFKKRENFIISVENNLIKEHIETSLPENVESDLQNALNKLEENVYSTSKSLIGIFLFINEFLAIHPFSDGNGRMSRLLVSWLLIQNNYGFVKHVSLSKYVLNQKKDYYDNLRISTEGLIANQLRYSFCAPFIKQYLKILYLSQKEYLSFFNNKNEFLKSQVEKAVFSFRTWFSAKDVLEIVRGIERTYVSKILKKLTIEKKLVKQGENKGTKYKVVKQC